MADFEPLRLEEDADVELEFDVQRANERQQVSSIVRRVSLGLVSSLYSIQASPPMVLLVWILSPK